MTETFLYSGPATRVSLGSGVSVRLHPGRTVELDAAHEYVAALLERGHLARTSSPQPSVRPKGRSRRAPKGALKEVANG